MKNKILEKNYLTKLGKTKDEFRKYFLLLFTKELIRHSKEEFFDLEHTIKRKEHYIKKQKPIHKPTDSFTKKVNQEFKKTKEITPPQIFQRKFPIKKRFFIPEQPLPPRLQYIKPYPTKSKINLGKIEPLAQNQNINIIECNGPEEKIIVKGRAGTKITNIFLNKEEINQILSNFSEASKIPLSEGIFKMAVGKYIVSAIVSDVIGSKFIIKKMNLQMPPPINYNYKY